MSPTSTRSGQHHAYVLPPPGLADWPPFARARAELERLEAEHRASGQQLEQLAEERTKAEHVDRRAAAGTLRRKPGAPHPGWPKRDEVDAAILAARERLEALGGALADAEADLEALIEEHRAAWVAEAQADAEAARGDLQAAIDALEAARRRLAERVALADWLENFPERATFRVSDSGPMPPLAAPHGGPPTWPEVLAALRAMAEPAPERPEAPERDARQWPARGIPSSPTWPA